MTRRNLRISWHQSFAYGGYMATTASPVALPRSSRGVGLVLASATSFGMVVVFAKAAYAAGVDVSSLLVWRFIIAAAALWIIVAVRRPAIPPGRMILASAGLGGLVYAFQGGLYYGSLARIDAGLAVLLLYTYPALVTVIAVALRRERADRRTFAALACSAVGLLLLLGLDRSGTADPVGVVMAMGAAVTYAVYVVVTASFQMETDPVLMLAIICTAAAASTAVTAAATGMSMSVSYGDSAWLWTALCALLGTVLASLLQLMGVRLVGASTCAILSCIEPLVAACTVALVYGERLTAGQLAGGLAVLASVVVLQTRFGQSDNNRRLVSDTRTSAKMLHPEAGVSDAQTNSEGPTVSAGASPNTALQGGHQRPLR